MGSTLIVFVGLVVANTEGACAGNATTAAFRGLVRRVTRCSSADQHPLDARSAPLLSDTHFSTSSAANTTARTALIVCVLLYNSYVFIIFGTTLLKEIQRVMTLETARPDNDHQVTDADRRTFLYRMYPYVAQRRGFVGARLRSLFREYACQLDQRLSADADGKPPPMEVSRARVKKQLYAAVAVACATERLRRTSLVVAWATQGALRRSDAEALAAYEARGRPPQALEALAQASEAHGALLANFRRLTPAARRRILARPRATSAPAAEEMVEAALAEGGDAAGAAPAKAEEPPPAEEKAPKPPRSSAGSAAGRAGRRAPPPHPEEFNAYWRFADRCVVSAWRATAALAGAVGRVARARRARGAGKGRSVAPISMATPIAASAVGPSGASSGN